RRVKQEADRLGLSTKHSTTASGTERGGKSFSRGHIYNLLSNPIYIGEIAHKGQLYPGQHPALIDAETWTAVRNQLATNASDHRHKADAAEPSLLAGVLVDARGERLTASHAVKKGRRYRYYISAALITEAGTDRAQSWRLPAQEIEDVVIRALTDALTSPAISNDRSRCAPTLIQAIVRGRAWFEELAAGRARSLRELAERDGITRRYVRRLVDLAFLSPELVEVILQGRQPVELTATRL